MYVLTVQVTLVQTVKLWQEGSADVDVRLFRDGVGGMGASLARDSVGRLGLLTDCCSSESNRLCKAPLLILPESNQQLQVGMGVQISSSLVQPSADGPDNESAFSDAQGLKGNGGQSCCAHQGCGAG